MAKADWRAREPKADDQKKKFDKLINQRFCTTTVKNLDTFEDECAYTKE